MFNRLKQLVTDTGFKVYYGSYDIGYGYNISLSNFTRNLNNIEHNLVFAGTLLFSFGVAGGQVCVPHMIQRRKYGFSSPDGDTHYVLQFPSHLKFEGPPIDPHAIAKTCGVTYDASKQMEYDLYHVQFKSISGRQFTAESSEYFHSTHERYYELCRGFLQPVYAGIESCLQCVLDERKALYNQNYETWRSEHEQAQNQGNDVVPLLVTIGVFAVGVAAYCDYSERKLRKTRSESSSHAIERKNKL